jgi:hypothetical protein
MTLTHLLKASMAHGGCFLIKSSSFALLQCLDFPTSSQNLLIPRCLTPAAIMTFPFLVQLTPCTGDWYNPKRYSERTYTFGLGAGNKDDLPQRPDEILRGMVVILAFRGRIRSRGEFQIPHPRG